MNWNPEIYLKAWHFASQMHSGQTYGGSEPGLKIEYINHIGSVATEIIHAIGHQYQYDVVLAIQCALLHDTLEDTAATYEQIVDLFGHSTAEGVLALTKDKSLPNKNEQMKDSLFRIRQQPQEVWMVKMADRITNLYHPPHYWKPAKIETYREEAVLIYDELKEAHNGLAQRLIEKIEAYQQFTAIQKS